MRENQKLKEVNLHVLDITKRAGLENKILQDPKMRSFYSVAVKKDFTGFKQNVAKRQQPSKIPMFKDGT